MTQIMTQNRRELGEMKVPSRPARRARLLESGRLHVEESGQ